MGKGCLTIFLCYLSMIFAFKLLPTVLYMKSGGLVAESERTPSQRLWWKHRFAMRVIQLSVCAAISNFSDNKDS